MLFSIKRKIFDRCYFGFLAPQKYIALLFTTGTTAIASLDIDVTTATGAFGPNQGALSNSTITDFLRGKGAKLGAPIAGTYFSVSLCFACA
jgi:hypothetical protein